jgi:hypothetical protein
MPKPPTTPISTTTTTTSTTTTIPQVKPQTPTTQKIELNFDELSDIGKHLITQWDIQAEMLSKAPLRVGDESILTITIKDKKTGEDISALMPIAFDFITSNDAIGIDFSFIQLVYDGKIQVHINAEQK